MKVAIVCGAPASEMLAPFDDPTWEIWCLGNRLTRYKDKRVSRIFEIHDYLAERHDPKEYAQWLVSHNIPIVVGEKFPLELVPQGFVDWIVFDYQCSEKLFGSSYLTASPAYMISQAISEGATEIGLYGVDLAVDDHEYFWQRPCVEAWIGFAKGRGIKVTVPEQSHIGRSKYIEGRHWDGKRNADGPLTEESFIGMIADHEAEMAKMQLQKRQLECDISAHSGAVQTYKNLAKVARAMEAQIDVKSIKDAISMEPL